MPWILHVSDPHLGDIGAVTLDDTKEIFSAQVDLRTTQKVFRHTLTTLARFAENNGPPDVVVVSGDLTVRAHDSGFEAFRALLDERSDFLPTDRSKIVVVPGNHDVVWDEDPGERARYAGFLSATRNVRCTTPLLDGVDFDTSDGTLYDEAERHPHLVNMPELLVVPMNTSNYCGVTTTPRGAWTVGDWHDALKAQGADTSEILGQLKKLHQRDVARVSEAQVLALGHYLDKLGVSRDPEPAQVRIAVLHHHLLPVSVREERKAFESLVNLQAIRELLRSYGINIVLHGHKHESSMYWDIAGDAHDLDGPQTQMLVISSPGHFDVKQPAMRAIMLDGPTTARNARIVTFAGAAAQRKTPEILEDQRVALWTRAMDAERRQRSAVAACNADEVYSRLRALFGRGGRATRHNLVCEIDDPGGADRIPRDYPDVGVADPAAWFDELVDWWQRPKSELVGRGIVPFNHGERVRRRWGDQVDRAVRMLDLRADSSRALVQLIGPRETGRYGDDERSLRQGSFPAFVLAEFSVNDDRLDCFAFFRKQEMQFWWPINVAELAKLQATIASQLERPLQSGRIVTFSAVALWRTALPAVAVPTVDLLVEDARRLWDMALAVAQPDTASPRTRADWQLTLADLQDTGRRPRLGLDLLAEHVRRLATVAPSVALNAVADALDALVEQYGVLADTERLNTTAVGAIMNRVVALETAVGEALP